MGKLVEDPGKDWPQILAIVVACLPGITSAFLFSWTSPFILVLINDKVNYNISEDEANLIPVLLPVGMMLSSVFFFKIHDLIGRKYTLLLLSIPQSLFWIITIFAKDIYSFYVARFMSGVADAIMYAALPIYIGEITTPKIRGTWGNGQTFSFNAGFLIINLLGSYLTIQQTAYICITLPLFSAILFIWLPESPYYYLMKGKEDKARVSLQWLIRKQNIEPDFVQLQSDVKRQISETGTWEDLFKISSNRNALIASVFLRIAQQLSGIACFETNIQFIFHKSSSTALSPQVSSIIFSGLLFVSVTTVIPFLDKMGRRKACIYSTLGCSIVLFAESVYFFIDEFKKEIDLSSFQWFPLVGLVVYVIVYCSGLSPLPSLMSSELFSASIKGKALSVSNVALGFIITLTTLTFKSLYSSVGLYAPFLRYSMFSFISCILSFYIVPETKGKTLEEIQQDLKGSYLTIHQTAYICLTLPVLSSILFIWLPESPYYYLMKGQEDNARASLQWLLRKKNIEPDFFQLQIDVQRQISETGTWADIFKISSNRKALTASIFLRVAQQVAGIACFETYIQFIFDKSSSTALSPQVSSIIFSAMIWVFMTTIIPFLDKMGRRKACIFSTLGCSIVLFAESTYFYVDEFKKDIDLSNFQWFPLVGLIVYVLVYCSGLGPLPSLMSSELFSASIKGKALSVTNVAFGFIVTISTLTFQTLYSSVGLYAPFLIYSSFSFISCILSFYIVPETKGKTLEEIQQDLKVNSKTKNIETIS